ncbi:uncharacterized protein LOC114304334 [Camellia sinensis]|uniref:Uncharacterized protein n=1 Tax=Camellia sinensis var. sinensis TaxID=542762 RepID=A0A4S4EJB7_CAMSN|nr:uncharacterized protein LOC114304334 [Camellia sinensis]THG16016.1 hypothetical protein TEA_009034 [Camellia sinensis var. sinensis]
MAEELKDGEFWLPPWFLTDDDVLIDSKPSNKVSRATRVADSGVYPFDFPCGFGSFGPYSDLSSPVESVMSSTETESDEDDYIAGLTRKMAHSTLLDDFWKPDSGFGYETQKSSWAVSESPQSTLCMGGFGCKHCSSRGSPNCLSPAVLNQNEASWEDLLYAAAGEVARMRMIEETTGHFQNRGLLLPPRKPSPISVPLRNPNPNIGLQSNHSLSYQQLQVAQFQQLKQQQMMKQQQNQSHLMAQNRARNTGRHVGLSPSAWPTLQQSLPPQQQPSSGMRAVFLGNTGSKRECTGTGVFLPRPIGSPTETRKKSGCSTVLLPDRVVQALNLNLDAMDSTPQLQSRYEGTFNPDYDAALNRNVRSRTGMNQELRLPPEWTC